MNDIKVTFDGIVNAKTDTGLIKSTGVFIKDDEMEYVLDGISYIKSHAYDKCFVTLLEGNFPWRKGEKPKNLYYRQVSENPDRVVVVVGYYNVY